MKKHAKKIVVLLLTVAILIPTVAMIFSSAAITDYPVELAFNNIFVFDKWANNKLSTTMVNTSGPVDDKLDISIEDGSFTFNNLYSGEAYTGHGMGTGPIDSAGNFQYYMMDVEPSSAYTFSYSLTSLTSGLNFTPYVFFFDESGSYLSLLAQPVSSTGDASFVFFVPDNARYIQVRFTISNTGSADVENIAIRKTDISSYGANIFDFDSWAGNANSGKVSDTADYNGGSIAAKNTTDNSVTLTANGTKTYLFTNFTFGSGSGYYMMPVEAGASYSYSYNLASCNFAPANYTPYILFYDSSSNYSSLMVSPATSSGDNRFVFTIPAGIAYIQIVYGISNAAAGYSCTVKDLAIQKISLATETNTGVPHRKVYTYKGDGSTYGELPVPSYAPNGYVFAGWYTGANGTGELITENTPVSFESYTVYPKYEPIVNSISIKTLPVKTEYTVGERVNPTGLVLEATVGNLTSTVESGYRCTPEYLTATGTQTVTVHYGGKTATYTVNVSASASKTVVVNGATVNVSVANNVYTFSTAVNTGEFNRYVITYNSDAYFEGIITYSDGVTEQFFLEPSSNFGEGETPTFTSFVDGYLEKVIDGAGKTTAVNSHTRSGIKSIAFTPLDNKSGTIDLLSITTSKSTQITSAEDTLIDFSDDKFKVVIDILNGGVVSGLYVLNSGVVARVYEHKDADNNITYETLVDYKDNLPDGYKSESTEVNLINTYDTGRYLQQSYYGTFEKPYETSYYNYSDWNYNPVQGGNVANEASKVIDYEIGDDYIYVKARPLDWAKWSDDHAADCAHETEDHREAKWGEEYITDTYVEAKYVFEDGVIKTYCRMVDYSGYPSAQTTQELPAFYTIEPLNNFVYNDVSEDEAWVIQNLKYDESPEFWGINQEYKNAHYSDGSFDANVDVAEHWAAFMASESSTSFGIGLYTPETTNFYYGCYPSIYAGTSNDLLYRHATSINPAEEDDSSYIAPIGVKTFESYKPTEYMYSLTTGTVNDIQDTFGLVYDERYEAELSRTTIGVPETIYMDPSATTSTTGQYFVNNRVDANGNLIADAKSNDTNGIISVYSPGSTAIEFNVTAITDGIGDPVIGGGTVESSYENTRWAHALIHEVYQSGADTDWFEFKLLDLAINGTGVAEGGTALLEWEITIYYGDNDTVGKTHYAYTTLYSPWIEPVGAATRAQTGNSLYDQSVAWISGVHGYTANESGKYWVAATDQTLSDEGEYSDKGTLYAQTVTGSNPETYAFVPLLNKFGTPSNTTTAVNKFLSSSKPSNGIDSPTIRYFSLSAKTGISANHGCLVADVSPVANLTVDTSRYTNLNQIPNLTVGYNITDVENNKGVYWYVSDFTDIANTLDTANNGTNGTGARFYNYTKQESASNIAQKAKNEWFDGDGTGVIIEGSATSNVAVTSGVEYNTAWNRAVVTGSENYDYIFKGAAHAHKNSDARAYSINYVQLRTSNVNKANLRDLVALASGLDKTNYTSASWSALETALQNAAIELGNPTDSDVSAATETLTEKLLALQTPVTLNANGGSFSGGATTTTVYLTCGPRLTPSYTIPVENNPTLAGHSVGGWSTDATAAEGTNPVIGGLKPTFYAIWAEGVFTLIYNANGGAGYISDATYKHSDSVELALSGFTREGYSLIGWAKSSTAATPDYLLGQTVSNLSNGTDTTVTLYAVWTENKYTVIYNANGGTGSIASQTVNGSQTFTLASAGFTRTGCTLLGWATNASASAPEYQLGQTVSRLAAGGSITLYAVWEIRDINVTFDNLIDFNAWNKVAGNGVVSDVTDTGFTITSNEAVSEATSSSPYFAVEAGKEYKIDIDITSENGWDVYIFFCDANGNWIDFVDGESNRYSNNTTWDTIFTAPNKEEVVKARIRVDCNGIKTGTDEKGNAIYSGTNTVTFNNIRVYEYDGIDIDVTPANKIANYKETFGTLPVPTREGYTFEGWYDGETLITETSTVTQTSTVFLKSKWVIADTALAADSVVIDFSTPIAITPFENDTVYNSISSGTNFLGISSDGKNCDSTLEGKFGSFTVSGKTITYKPEKVATDTEVIYYHASVTADNVTTEIKNTITVAPASNILYEESFFEDSNALTGVAWEDDDDAKSNINQESSPINNEIYGYDSNTAGYNRINNYSNGSAKTVTVTADDRMSKNTTFTFSGTGFDLVSACGSNTGVMIVSLRENNADGTVTMKKSYVVDTYYGDSAYGTGSYNTLYQVPIINERTLPHGNYTVQVVASYLPSMSGAIKADEAKEAEEQQKLETGSVNGIDVNTASGADNEALRNALAEIGMEYVLDAESVEVVWFDDNSILNGGMGVNTPVASDELETASLSGLVNVIDSIRVYNPLDTDDSCYNGNEKNATYYNVIDNLVDTNGDLTGNSNNFFAYVTGKLDDGVTLNITNYMSVGPKDELYLAGSATDGITFTIKNFVPDTTKVMISLRAASGTPMAKFGDKSFNVKSNTEMYYDITDYVDGVSGVVTIQNTALNTLLSVGSLKITSPEAATASLSTEFDLMTARTMMMAEAEEVEPNTTLTPEEPVNPEEPSTDDSSECWLIRIFKWVIEMFIKLIDIFKGFFRW